MQVAAARPDPASVLAADPGAVVETVAREHGVTTREVVEALPAAMRKFAPASAFIDAMKDIATWGEVTLIVHTDDGIMYKVFVGRDEKRDLLGDQLAKFRALAERFGAKGVARPAFEPSP